MNINIEIAEDGKVVINDKIFADGSMTILEVKELVEEYKALGIAGKVYTPLVMEMKCKFPKALISHFERMEVGGTMGYNQETIVKISPHFCQVKESNIVQLDSDFKTAV